MPRRFPHRLFIAALAAAACLSACRSRETGPLFPAPMGGRWGFINVHGKKVIPGQFDNARVFSENRAAVSLSGRWGYIDRSGQVVIPAVQRSAGEFRNGLAIVDSGLPDRPFGLMNSSGTWVVQPSFRRLGRGDETGDFFIGQIGPGDGSGFYDAAGHLVFGPFGMVFPFHEGLARVENGVLDTSGTVTLQGTSFESIRFSEGLIAVRENKRVGYMDAAGRMVIPARWEQGGDFSEGLAPVQDGMFWFFIDRTGNVTVKLPENVRQAMPLSEGRSLVTADRDSSGRKLGYLDRAGQWIVPPSWDDAEPFEKGLARVGDWKSNTLAYIDLNGKVVWQGRAP